MGELNGMDFDEFVEKIVKTVGMAIEQRTENYVTIVGSVGDGRKQRVWIRPLGLDYQNRLIIGVMSPAMVLVAGQELAKGIANSLLRDNSRIIHGGWAIESTKEGDYLIVKDTLIANTTETAELEASMTAVAIVADEMEKRLQQDVF